MIRQKTYVSGLDSESLGNRLIQLLHIRKIADLTSRGAMGKLAVENHVKLLRRGGRRGGGGRGHWLILLSLKICVGKKTLNNEEVVK